MPWNLPALPMRSCSLRAEERLLITLHSAHRPLSASRASSVLYSTTSKTRRAADIITTTTARLKPAPLQRGERIAGTRDDQVSQCLLSDPDLGAAPLRSAPSKWRISAGHCVPDGAGYIHRACLRERTPEDRGHHRSNLAALLLLRPV